jgi:hypothetical protein
VGEEEEEDGDKLPFRRRSAAILIRPTPTIKRTRNITFAFAVVAPAAPPSLNNLNSPYRTVSSCSTFNTITSIQTQQTCPSRSSSHQLCHYLLDASTSTSAHHLELNVIQQANVFVFGLPQSLKFFACQVTLSQGIDDLPTSLLGSFG